MKSCKKCYVFPPKYVKKTVIFEYLRQFIFEYLRQFILHIRSCQVFFSKLGWFHILLAKMKFSILQKKIEFLKYKKNKNKIKYLRQEYSKFRKRIKLKGIKRLSVGIFLKNYEMHLLKFIVIIV